MANKPFAFVLMPFDHEFDDIYRLGIQAAAQECGVAAERVDEQSFSETILERIYRQIRQADFVIADMTGRNANVFYEVGYAHAHEKLCTLLTQSADDIPFDLKHHRHIVYSKSISKLKSKLVDEMSWLKSQVEGAVRPITVELSDVEGDIVNYDFFSNVEASIAINIHNKTRRRSPEIEAIYLHTTNSWRFVQGGEECPTLPIDAGKNTVRHFIKPPVARLSPGAWAQIKVLAKRQVWNNFRKEELQESYRFAGNIVVEIVTNEGNFLNEIFVDVDTDSIPF